VQTETTRRKKHLTGKVLVFFAFIVLLQSGFLLLLSGLLDDTERRLKEERYARSVVAAIAKFSATHQFTAAALINQTRYKTVTLTEYREIFSRLPHLLDELKGLFKNRPEELERLKDLDNSVAEAMDLSAKLVAGSRDKETAEKKMMYHHYCIQLIDLSEHISIEVDEITARYKEMQESASLSTAAMSDWLVYVCLILGFAINAGVAVALYNFFVRGLTERLNVIAVNTVNIAERRPLLEPLEGDDEIADVDRTFRDMAMNLEAFRTKEKTILEHAANFICLIKKNGDFISVPPACGAIFGFAPEVFDGKQLQSIATDQTKETTLNALAALSGSGSSIIFENQIRCPDKSIVDLSWTATVNDDGHVVCVAHDITERKRITKLIAESEARFTTIVEKMPVAVISCDRNFVIESLNSTTTSMFRYKVNELLGKPLGVLLTDPSIARQKKVSDEIKEVTDLASKETTQLSVWCKDGSQIPVELNLNAYAAPQGERLLACFSDISARVELELAKRDFVSMIGHDLRSPLMSLYGTLGMIAADGEKPVFARAEKIVEGLVALINDFLDLGKMESASDTILAADMELEALFGAVRSEADLNADLKDCKLVFKTEDFNPMIRADRDRLSKAIVCLVSTMKHFNDKLQQVSITASERKDFLVLSIDGSDCWLPQAVKETCAEGYSFVEMSKTYSTSGLRLALSRAIIEAHQGSIVVCKSGTNEFFELEIALPSE